MHPAALLLALTLSAHAVPVLNSRGNDTYERRDVPYRVVNVAGPTTPIVETITATSPPATITVTEYPSSTPDVVPGPSYSSWPAGSVVSDASLERRESNNTKRAFRRFGAEISDATAINSTETHAIAARSNDTIPAVGEHAITPDRRSDSRNETDYGLNARSNTTSEVFARGNDTISKVVARQPSLHESEAANSTSEIVARSNDTVSKIAARGVDIAQRAVNDSKVTSHPVRDLNGTALQVRELNATNVDAAAASPVDKRRLNTTEASPKVFARSSNDTVIQSRQIQDAVTDDAAWTSKHDNATKLAIEPKARALNKTKKAPIPRVARSSNETVSQGKDKKVVE
ncbi:hypothetical protein BO94DRAFT_55249 [Aspergillus sclerotioniger CBS 115572]|uniref:Uncharacterized protein n=1 Tax=Aspergillus sclerotioniger CBS 115572 TaxID=1450535 RepID=A0A317WP83_9EURO|nr:hypothetical protein BO94DRAFT_55249 [Aspergillus sclerotioniger CBS 115572]PWY87815.1 hypothetical protein BO94DRAFT_55249 [Aspergillus sclerotioniger CBS 115572]